MIESGTRVRRTLVMGALWLAACDDGAAHRSADAHIEGSGEAGRPNDDGGSPYVLDTGAALDAAHAETADAEVVPGADATFGDASARDGAASTLDASHEDAGDASTSCRLTHGFSFTFVGQSGVLDPQFAVSAEGVYRRTYLHANASEGSCMAALPACGSTATDGGDLDAALQAPGVAAQWTNSTDTVVLGEDLRSSGGAVLVIVLDDGRQLTVGNPCTASTGCVPIPSDVDSLTNLLFNLSSEQSAAGPCLGPGL